MLSHHQQIESLLFYKGEPVSLKDIAHTLEITDEQAQQALITLRGQLENRGIVLVEHNNTYALGTHPEMSSRLQVLRKEELQTPLSKSALETLTIIAYKKGVTKHELDYIRGVNSQFMVRNLLVRGLIEKSPNPNDKRSPLYRPTLDLLAYLGISSVEELPEYHAVEQRLNEALADSNIHTDDHEIPQQETTANNKEDHKENN